MKRKLLTLRFWRDKDRWVVGTTHLGMFCSGNETMRPRNSLREVITTACRAIEAAYQGDNEEQAFLEDKKEGE